MNRLRRDSGLSLIEVLVASGILAIAIAVFLTFQMGSLREVDRVEDRAFAISRATAMIEEMKAYVEGGSETHAELLDDFDDGSATNPVLSTQKEVRSPDDPVSGNQRMPGGLWKYTRRVNVSKLAGIDSRDVRQVTVTVYRADPRNPAARVLAEVSRVIRTIGSYMPPTQVVDVYALALENVPGWWVNMSTLKPLVENAFNDMEAVNPGLEFRLHWITRLSYGRDARYAPFVNQDVDASKLVKWAYFYPGVIDGSGFTYFSPAQISGRLNVDGEVMEPTHGESNVPGYTLADQFNAAMREPDERALWERRRAAGFDKEPSLRILLDDMATHPDQYRNAMMINLHGELIPLPPVRNYSDAAKTARLPNVRVVTHPEHLRYRGFDDVKLRVYSYVTDPDAVNPAAEMDDDVVVSIPGVDVHKSVTVTRIGQGYDATAVEPQAEFDGSATVIRLPKSPLRAAKKGEQGLATSARLYGWEYIPAPVEEAGDFSTDLRDAGDGPKNTARWIITLPGSVLPDHVVLPIETRIGADPPDLAKEPWNRSRTYVWIDETPPPSESAQFQGDPRYEPYGDLKRDHRYNWFFTKVGPVEESGYGGYERTQDGWAVDKVDLDVPRYFSLYREALLQTDAVFTTMNGFSFFYLGVGGELGSDEPNGYPKGLPLNDLPYGGKGDKTTFISEIHEQARVVASDNWYARPWLGELFPDREAKTWMETGNLPAGQFRREKYTELPGHPFSFDRRKRTDRYGASAFFNSVGPANRGPFTHRFENKNQAAATADGRKLGATFNLNTPPTMTAYRPFVLDGGINYPPEWQEPEYVRTRVQSRLARTLYDASMPHEAASSALMELSDATGTRAGFFVVNGLSPAGVAGTAFMGRYAAITLMEGFMIAGEGVRPSRVAQLPRIVVTSPSEDQELMDPQKIHVQWDVTWKRWDGEPYTDHFRDGFAESTPLSFAVKFSTDGGLHWKIARTGADTKPGERPGTPDLVGGNSYDWDVSEMQPGPFLVRVEAYRTTIPLHYSYHQVRQNIRR